MASPLKVTTSLCQSMHCLRLVQLCTNRTLQTSAVCCKNARSGIPKLTNDKKVRFTYETAQYPYQIGVTKSWNSWHTSNLYEEEGASDAALEDDMIRRFISGIWFRGVVSECIIKRRFNTIAVAFIASKYVRSRDMYFLKGFTEELLSHFLKRPVKLEVQTSVHEDMEFKCV